MVDQEIRVLGDENIIANPKNSQKQYPLTFKAVPNVIVYGRKKDNLNFTVPIPEGVNFNFNLDRTSIIFSDNFNLEEYSYIMVKNPFEEIQDFFYVSSLEELDPTGKEFNEFNDEVVKWLRRLVNIISNRCMIFETTLFKDLNNFPNIKSGQTFIRTDDGWTGITIRDINSELDIIFNKYVEEINKKIQEHQTQMNELLEQWKQDIQKYAENVKQYEIVRIVTQSGHGFVFEPVMYSISQRKFVKALFPHGADGIAVRVDDNNFRLVWSGRVEIPAAAKDTQQRDFVLGEYYFLGEGSNGGIQREKPDTYYQHLFQVMYSDELQQNIADVLLSVPINQKGKRWDVGEAKTTVNDIEELKMSDFPVGKVVEVLGYYTAGDGAGHKRIIASEDDGSGVQLSNNLWACIVHNGEVDVSWFGIQDNVECLDILQKIVDNTEYKTVIIDKNIVLQQKEGTAQNNSGLVIKSEKTLNFINNCKIKLNGINSKHSSVVSIMNNTDKVILINPYLIGDKEENTSSTGEWGMGLNIINSTDIEVINLTARNCFGDGVYISNENKNSNIIFLGITDIKNCRRQGVSIIEADGVYFEYLKCEDIIGTAPQAAIDLEPNNENELIKNIVIDTLESINCEYDLLAVSKNGIDVKVKNIISKNVRYSNLRFVGKNLNVDIENIYSDTTINKTSVFSRIDNIINSNVNVNNAYIKNKNVIESASDYHKAIIYYEGNNLENIECNLMNINNLNLINCNHEYFLYMYRCPDTQIVKNNMITSNTLGRLILKGNYQLNLEDRSGERITLTEKNILPFYDKPIIYATNKKANISKVYPIYENIVAPSTSDTEIKFTTAYIGGLSLIRINYITTEKSITWKYYHGIIEKQDLNNYNGVGEGSFLLNTFDPASINGNNYRGIQLKFGGSSNNRYSLIMTHTGKLFLHNTNINKYKEIAFTTETQQLNTPYMATKMQQEGVYGDFITYMDEKTAYDKQQRKLEQDRQLAYEEALKENPELTYEEFMSVQPMILNLVEEPQPSDALKKFMDKYL